MMKNSENVDENKIAKDWLEFKTIDGNYFNIRRNSIFGIEENQMYNYPATDIYFGNDRIVTVANKYEEIVEMI